ncbi:ABC transporter ATP-binding protein [Ruminococcus flavefaciens]|uniref:ABC transporter ATP-binding protein n=1 Tax=Ruminococcus flavefaciens TaxID=1265 RepID=UPI0026EB077F|nr:ABC transporter ATP-binding protein [Ruminococcus flavefaciens]MDD7517293.1 ABC transporter ATP-binding protein [Ruminococcus flavefaciens]MDY5690824.1 ABC transporter ATP-binding protein [Ruminococcus flavefaciens]
MFKTIFSHVGKYKKQAILSPVTIIGEVFMEVLIPAVMAMIIDNGIKKGNIGYVAKMGGLMVVMSICSLCFGALAARFSAVAAMGFAKNLRSALFRKVQDFSFANVDKFSTASLTTRLTTDVTNIQNAFMMFIRSAFRSPIMLICATFMAIKTNAKLSLVFLVAIPVLAFAVFFIISKAHPRFEKMLGKYDSMNGKIQENLIGIRVVKAFAREEHEKKSFEENTNSVRLAQFAAEKLVILNMPIMQLIMYASITAILYFGGHMAVDGNIETGQLSSFIMYVGQILMSLMMLSMLFIMFVVSRASLQRIYEVLMEEPTIKDADDSQISAEDGSVRFENVSFSYYNDMSNLALEKINLNIKSGETIGIIGGTGSSKTSLVQLIPRLYDATEGKVLVGGHDVKEYSLDTLRNQVAMVLQKNVLFSGTIKENLRWGDENATDEEIIEACKSACAHDFIMGFPDGYDTDLGQGGVNVSGGQKQRLCIARALLKKPKIIILDDSTSAVDTATDSSIRKAFSEKLSDTTTIIIAQRITSVMDADRIIVMDGGKITDIGTHDELMQKSEIYREVYESQQKGADE